MFRIVFLIIFALIFSACQSPETNRIQEVLEDFKASLKDAKRSVEDNTPDTKKIKTGTAEEVEKLFSFEYKVEEYPNKAGAKDLQSKLEALGQERWECFYIQEVGTKLRVYCKRRPKTYLQYIPRMF